MTIRERSGKFQAIVVLKRDGAVVHQEAKTFETRALAKDWRERLLKKLRAEGVPARQRAKHTLGDLIEKHRKVRSEARPLRRAAEHELDQLILMCGDWRLDALRSDKFVALARKRRAEGAGPTTILHNLATLRSILNAAKPMFGIDVNGSAVGEAIEGLRISGHVSKSNSREVRVSDDILNTMEAEFLRILPNPSTVIDMAKVMWLAVHLPRRLGELCDMRWEDYNGKTVVLRDTKHPVKPRTETVPVPPKAQAIINQLPKVDERILPYKTESVSAAWQRACARKGVEDIHFHDLRHEGICRLFEKGLQIQEVALISGHQSWSMLRRYTHLNPNTVLEKLE